MHRLRYTASAGALAVILVARAAAAEPAGPVAAAGRTGVLDEEALAAHVARFNAADEELYPQHIPNAGALDFLRANVPRFECPDQALEEIYYFRWWTYRKHIKATPDGFVITEFLPPVGWASKHNTISCAAGHHLYEGRWLRDPRYVDDYTTFWLRRGTGLHRYSHWLADAIWARYAVTGDAALPKELLPDLVENFRLWERERRDPNGLFWQVDGADGMEVAIGGTGYRATLNSYMFGDARAIAAMARLAGREELARQFDAEAARLKALVQEKLWDHEAQFFKMRKRPAKPGDPEPPLADVRELYGYTPWYFNLPDSDKAGAWRPLMDPQGFYAPFGPTTAEQRHPGFRVAYAGHECQWNGPSWPLSTAVTLTALANLLNNYRQDLVGKRDYWQTFQCYTRSHRFRQLPPEAPALTRSHDNTVARHTWWAQERLGGTEWVQYAFKAPVTADAVEVFWYDDAAGIDPPAAWRLLALHGDAWQEVRAKGPCGAVTNRFNRVMFEPVTTTALRLEARAAAGMSAGILEWRVFQGGTNVAPAATPSASYSDSYAARLSALNDGERQTARLETEQSWIDENLNPFNGDWIARTLLRQRGQKPAERGKDYNHSTFCDLVITGLAGLRPRADDVVEVNPLAPEDWDFFCLDNLPYHGRTLTILWDRTGARYGRGAGLRVLADGREIAQGATLARVTGKLAR